MSTTEGQPELRVKLVDQTSDLADLRASVGTARGQLVSARRGVGNELLLRIRPDGKSQPDDWRIGSQASDWVLASSSDVMAGAFASSEAIDAVLSDLDGAGIRRVEVTDGLGLVIVFADGRWLEVQGLIDDEDEQPDDPPYWEVFTPRDELLRAGPGPIWVRSGSVRRPPVARTATLPQPEYEGLDDEELLRVWAFATAELWKRGISRAPIALGDLAAELVRKHFGGFRGTYDQAGWDVLTASGERIEVKAVRSRQPDRLPQVTMHQGDFDALVVVVFGENLSVEHAWHLPGDVVARSLSDAKDRAGRQRLRLREALREPAVSELDL